MLSGDSWAYDRGMSLEVGERYCQVNGSKDVIVPKRREVFYSSLHTNRLLPIGKSQSSEELIMNCFEEVATDSEQVLN